MSDRIAILAYGSLIEDPGKEIAGATAYRLTREIMTPFNVEFARSSGTREGAPTLVPVTNGGAHIRAQLLVLRDEVSEQSAKDMLWRRETGRTGPAPEDVESADAAPNQVRIRRLSDFNGISVVLYTQIAPNIQPLTPQHLAELALSSACSPKIAEGRDGISYLMSALRNGICTPFSGEYEQEIKRHSHAHNLAEALEWARAQRQNPP
jgi:hypothetical protein